VRLLLDANLSPRTIGEPLGTAGHDVRALAAHPELEELADPDVLDLAAAEGRILITRNSRDFPARVAGPAASMPDASCSGPSATRSSAP
jgi:predicted nuclease of predicted toxin-antitoxin system